MANRLDRTIGVAAALIGASGVGLAAVGAHAAPGQHLDVAGSMAVIHAAALFALTVDGPGSAALRRIAAVVIVLGVVLFSGDLAARALLGRGLFPMAAPTGGLSLIGGWLLAGLGYLLPRGR